MPPTQRAVSRPFFSLSQLILSSGPLYHLNRSHRVSYIEVEVRDQQTGRPVHLIDKVHPSSTVLDLKNRFHKAYGPLLQDAVVLRTIASSSLLTVYSTDLGRQVSWTTVFLTQYVGPLLIYLIFYCRLSSVYDDTGKSRRPLVVHLACFCHSLHYVKHLLETLFVHRLSDGSTPLRNLLKASAFYWGFTSWLGYYINHPLYTPPYFANKQVIPCFIWFLICEAGNLFINIALAQHPKTVNSPPYPRPTYNPFTWLFKLVHSPQYTYEIGAWISLSIMTQTVPVFAVLVSTQMLLWARKRRGKCLGRTDSGSYPRSAVIPFIL